MNKIFSTLVFILSLSANAQNQVEFIPAEGSVGSSEVSSIPASKISNFSQAVQIEFPAGMISPFATSSCPVGWLKADGSPVSRVEKARLFLALGVSHGSGNGSSTFNLPDYRGRFLRGVDENAGRDPEKTTREAMNPGGNTGNQVGSVQSDQYKVHTHIQNPHGHRVYRTNSTTSGEYALGSNFVNIMSGDRGGTYVTNNTAGSPIPYIENSTATNQNSGGAETRPINAYVIYCVKE